VKRFWIVIAIACATLFLAGPGFAQGKDDARRFFNAGQKAFAAGRYVEAAKSFEEAFRLKPHPAPLINAGDSWEKAGELALAARVFQRVVKLEQSTEQDRSEATERLAKITPKLGTIELEGEASQRARVDDDEFKGGDRVYVVPGQHMVTLIDVDDAKERKIDVAAGTSRTVDLKTLLPAAEKNEKPKPPTTAGTGTIDEPGPGPDQTPMKKGGVRPLTIAVLGLGVVAAGGAVYFGLQVNDAEKSYNDDPNQDDLDRFKKNKLYTNVCIGAAVVGLGLGTFLLVKDLNRKVPAKASAKRRQPISVGFMPLAGGGVLSSAARF
jgi:tetratricopeptide (TPR) repeat protein